jgi:hypothetical protein
MLCLMTPYRDHGIDDRVTQDAQRLEVTARRP